MQIEKILIVESPVKLFRIIDSKNEILDRADGEVYLRLMEFCDRVQLYVNGCKCDAEENYSAMIRAYSELQSDDKAVEHLTKCIECDRIEFK